MFVASLTLRIPCGGGRRRDGLSIARWRGFVMGHIFPPGWDLDTHKVGQRRGWHVIRWQHLAHCPSTGDLVLSLFIAIYLLLCSWTIVLMNPIGYIWKVGCKKRFYNMWLFNCGSVFQAQGITFWFLLLCSMLTLNLLYHHEEALWDCCIDREFIPPCEELLGGLLGNNLWNH